MILSINKKTLYRFIRFGIVGVINTVLDLAILNFLVYLFKVENSYVFSLCKGLSFVFAVVNSYYMNKYFTFSKKNTTKKDFGLFILISLIGLVVNILVCNIFWNYWFII